MCDRLKKEHPVSKYTKKEYKIVQDTWDTSGDTSATGVSDVFNSGDTFGDTSGDICATVVSDVLENCDTSSETYATGVGCVVPSEVHRSDKTDDILSDNLEKVSNDNRSDHAAPVTRQDKLSVIIPHARVRCRSPVTVQEWVAALPDTQEEEEDVERGELREEVVHVTDNLRLGAEGVFTCSAICLICKSREGP